MNLSPTHLRRRRNAVVRKNARYAGRNIVVREKLSLAHGARQVAVLRCVVKDGSNVPYWHAGELFMDFCGVQSRFEVANDGVRRNPETVDVRRTMKLERIALNDRASRPVDFFGYQHTFSISQRSSRDGNRLTSRARGRVEPTLLGDARIFGYIRIPGVSGQIDDERVQGQAFQEGQFPEDWHQD